jgi:hypothetical protein
MDNIQCVRKPPYQEEAIRRLKGEDVHVKYELEVQPVQKVNPVTDSYKTTIHIDDYVKIAKSDETQKQLTEEHKNAIVQADFGVPVSVLKDLLGS